MSTEDGFLRPSTMIVGGLSYMGYILGVDRLAVVGEPPVGGLLVSGVVYMVE